MVMADCQAPHLDEDEYPTQITAVFGDEAARTLGYEPIGSVNGLG